MERAAAAAGLVPRRQFLSAPEIQFTCKWAMVAVLGAAGFRRAAIRSQARASGATESPVSTAGPLGQRPSPTTFRRSLQMDAMAGRPAAGLATSPIQGELEARKISVVVVVDQQPIRSRESMGTTPATQRDWAVQESEHMPGLAETAIWCRQPQAVPMLAAVHVTITVPTLPQVPEWLLSFIRED